MHHGCGVEEIGVASTGEQPQRMQQRQQNERVQVHGQCKEWMAEIYKDQQTSPYTALQDVLTL